MLSDRAKQAKREYHRKWQRANKDKVKSYQEKYWEGRTARELEKLDLDQEEVVASENATTENKMQITL